MPLKMVYCFNTLLKLYQQFLQGTLVIKRPLAGMKFFMRTEGLLMKDERSSSFHFLLAFISLHTT